MREIERANNNVKIWHALNCYPLAKISKLKISKNCIVTTNLPETSYL